MKVFVWGVVIICLFSCATAYRPVLTKSTEQSWAGGVQGNKGTNYYVELESSKSIEIDSLYFQDKCFRLDSTSRGSNSYYLVDDKLYRIIINVSNSNSNHSNGVKTPPLRPTSCSAPTFNGAAMVTFRYNDKRDTLVIPSFDQLPRLVYP